MQNHPRVSYHTAAKRVQVRCEIFRPAGYLCRTLHMSAHGVHGNMWGSVKYSYERYPDLDGNKWWIKVDDDLTKMYKTYNLEAELLKWVNGSMISWCKIYSIFNLRYREDIKKYGDPSDSERKVAVAMSLSNWQVVLQAHTKKVEIALARSNGGRKSKKRAAPNAWGPD